MRKSLIKSAIFLFGVFLAGHTWATKVQFPNPKLLLMPPNAQGERLYFVLLRTDFVRALGDAGEAPAVHPSDMRPTDDGRAWHRPDTRKMVRFLEREYQITAIAMTSWIAPSLTAYLSEETLQALDNDPRVDTIELVTMPDNGTDFSSAPPWSDNTSGAEYISYGKYAMDMNDNVTPTNKVYMLDAGLDANGLAHVDLDAGNISQPSMGVSNCAPSATHSSAVASILAAEHGNNAGIKGVNNTSPVVVVRKGCDHVNAPTAMDWAAADMEASGIFGVINMSANSANYIDGTTAAKYIRKASARALFVQSAGNDGVDACTRAYSPTVVGDGILVIGAVDQNGGRVPQFDYRGVPGGTLSSVGSNYGACVEGWAPGQLIWIDWADSTHTTRYMWSGTSFAAPHVAAMASRYGTSSTNPVIREAYIRSKLFSTGFTDPGTGGAIKVPSYTQAPLFTLPTKLTPASLSVSSTYLTNVASNATDSNYFTTTWNSGVTPNYPSVQPYFQMDLGATKTLYSIRFMPSQSPSGTSTHEVWVGNSNPPTTLAASITRNIMDGETMAATLAGFSARYVRVVTKSSPSWAAYYEVEVFGN